MADWFRDCGNGRFILSLHIQPGAKKSECAGLHGDALKIRLAAPPVDGKANAALIALVAKALDLPRADVTLARGGQSRLKMIEVAGLDDAELRARITAA